MPKIELSKDIVIDSILYGAFINFIFDLSWQSCVVVISSVALKSLSLIKPQAKSVPDTKVVELEERLLILKKELTNVKLKIGLER